MQPPSRPHKARGKPDIPKVGRGVPSPRASDPPSTEFLIGLEEFNAGRYFECHETLEALWVAETDPIRYVYQGILQIGVGLYHCSRGNFRGATSLMRRGMTLLQPFRPTALGVEIDRLLDDNQRCYAAILALGAERLGELPSGLLPKVRLTDEAYEVSGS